MQESVAADLAGLQPSYRVAVSRAQLWAFGVASTLVLGGSVLRLFSHPDGFDLVLSIAQLGFFGPLLVVNTVRRPTFYLAASGLRFRRFLRTGPLITWGQIRDVQVQGRWQGRWQEHSTVVLRDGRLLPLAGMPAEDAQRLADALQATRRGEG